jgi:hypothetical protein
MGREQRRLLIDPLRLQQASAGLVALTPAESRYLVKVLRFGSGAVFAISDGAGGLWEAELVEPQRAQLVQPLEAPLLWQPPPTPPLVLLAALVKRDYDLVLRMAVELGADWLLPCRADSTTPWRASPTWSVGARLSGRPPNNASGPGCPRSVIRSRPSLGSAPAPPCHPWDQDRRALRVRRIRPGAQPLGLAKPA